MPKTPNGYTLIELLVVIGILAVVAAVATPVAAQLVRSADTRSDVYLVMTALRSCQEKAMRRQQTVTVADSTEPFFDCGASDIKLSDQAVVDVQQAPSYFADGTSSGGQIVVKHGRHQAVITIAWLTGAVAQEQS